MDWRVRMAIDAMRRDLDRPLGVSDLARRVNLSRSRFTHLFRAHVGCSPARYLREARLDRARQLLEQTSLSIKQVMAQVGVNDPSHFARDFFRRYGASPREFRARARSPGRLFDGAVVVEQVDPPTNSRFGQRIAGPRASREIYPAVDRT